MNLKHRSTVRLFEIGAVYLPEADARLPRETRRLVIALTGQRSVDHWDTTEKQPQLDFFDLKGLVEEFLLRLHVPSLTFEPLTTTELHPGQSAEVKSGKQVLGKIGQLHPQVAGSYELGRRKIVVADLDLECILELMPAWHSFESISTFPPVLEDIALVVDETLPAEKLEAEIKTGGGELLRSIRLFDVYRGQNLPAGKKSLAYALTYQAMDRSLTDKEVSKVRAKIVGRVEKLLGAVLRA